MQLVLLLKRSVGTVEFRPVEINTSSNAKTVQLAKTKAKTHSINVALLQNERILSS